MGNKQTRAKKKAMGENDDLNQKGCFSVCTSKPVEKRKFRAKPVKSKFWWHKNFMNLTYTLCF